MKTVKKQLNRKARIALRKATKKLKVPRGTARRLRRADIKTFKAKQAALHAARNAGTTRVMGLDLQDYLKIVGR